MALKSQKWFVVTHQKPGASTRLFCFPYAGGNAATYAHWSKQLHPEVEVIGLQLPGRANRLFEPAYSSMAPLTDAIFEQITPLLDRPFAFFGHSLGSRVAFDLMKKMNRNNLPLPSVFFASGSRAPSIKPRELATYSLPDAQFIEHLRTLSGTPDAIIDNPDLMAVCLPLLRADFELSETYLSNTDHKLDTRLHIFSGREDSDITRLDLMQWSSHFIEPGQLTIFSGGHFFIDQSSEPVLEKVDKELMRMPGFI